MIELDIPELYPMLIGCTFHNICNLLGMSATLRCCFSSDHVDCLLLNKSFKRIRNSLTTYFVSKNHATIEFSV